MWGLPQRVMSRDFEGNAVEESFVPIRDCQQSFSALCDEVTKNHVFKSEGAASRFVDRKIFHNWRVDDAEHIADKMGVERTFMSFFDWVSLAWYHVVGTGNVDHFFAGCRVEKLRSWGGVMSYCAKYMSKADSENFMSDVETGRSWGIFNRANMPWAKLVEMNLDDVAGTRLRRIARRFLEKRIGRRVQRHYGMTLYCDVSQWKRLLARPPDVPF
jgi:hypothetical protein